jgi:hypothetical protein
MSQSHSHLAVASSSSFQTIINNALKEYERRTKKDLLLHPLASELQACNSPDAILAVLQQQVQALDQSRNSDDRWTKWLGPTVNVLYTLSDTLGEGVGLVSFRTRSCPRSALKYVWQVFSPAKPIFVGVGVLLSVRISLNISARPYTNAYISQTVKDVRGSQDTLVDVFERIESFLRRLEIYTEVRPTSEMMNTVIQIMVEVLSILGIATKEIKDGVISE